MIRMNIKYRTKSMILRLLSTMSCLIFVVMLIRPVRENKVKLIVHEQDFTKSVGYVSVRPTLYTQNDYKIPVCFTMAAFTQHGGTENWVRGIINLIEKSPYFYVFGIYSWDLVSDEYKKLLDKHLIYNIMNYDDISLYCSLVLSTAHVPITKKTVFKVLVVHGGMNSQWTYNYAKFHKQFDYIVGVSADSLLLIEGQSSSYIPSLLLDHNESCGEIMSCDRLLTFVGRISPEKRPEKVCNLLSKLPEFCAIIIGPFYFGSNHFTCDSPNVKYLGPMNNATCYIKQSEAILIPSSEEGGPIVAIESWRENKPVFMQNIGLAKSCPECFIIYNWDKADPNEFRSLINNHERINDVVKKANEVFLSDFSALSIEKKWNVVFSSAINKIESYGPIPNQIKWMDSNGFFVRRLGRTLRLNCFSTECSIKIVIPKTSTKMLFKGLIQKGLIGSEKIEDGVSTISSGEFIIRTSHSDFMISDFEYQ